jgi:hypothetical protein
MSGNLVSTGRRLYVSIIINLGYVATALTRLRPEVYTVDEYVGVACRRAGLRRIPANHQEGAMK